MPLARISLTLSRHFSRSFIASGRSSGLHPVSSHSCCMYVGAGRPAFARPYVGVHKSTSLMSSSLFLQQCPAYLVRLILMALFSAAIWRDSVSLLRFPFLSHIQIIVYSFRVFLISVSWWSFTRVWVIASRLKSPELFLVFWPFSMMLSFGWSPLGRQLPSPPVPLIIL